MTDKCIKSDQPCPCGKSSDGFALYSDGHGYCFSFGCEKKYYFEDELEGYESGESYSDNNNIGSNPRDYDSKSLDDVPREYSDIPDKGISIETCRKFNTTVKKEKGIIKEVYYNYKTLEDDIPLVKIKDIEVKKARSKKEKVRKPPFTWPGRDKRKVKLCGADVFPKGSAKAATLTEGEDDMMAAYQLMGSKYPVYSIPDGVSNAIKSAKDNFELLDSYETIVICFDMDEPGQKAAHAVASLFPGKAKIMKMASGKDASDYTTAKKYKEFVQEWWQSDLYTPDGIITGKGFLERVFAVPEKGISLCWEHLSGKTHGVRKHELWTFGGGTASGKTEVFKEIGYDLMINHDARCGFFFLEEAPDRTTQCLVSKDVDERVYLDGVDPDGDKRRSAPNLNKIAENSFVYDHKGMSDFDNIKEKINYFVTALGCEYIFLDHITAMAEGKEGDVNAKCHYIMEELNRLLQAREFSIFLISHLRKANGKPAEEGGRVTLDDFYGSSSIKQRSNFVFGIEGNQQAEGDEKNLRYLRCLKDRNVGLATGSITPLKYDHKTGRLLEFDEEIEELYEGIE